MVRTTMLLLAGVVLFASGCNNAEMKEFSPSNGAFKIQMPRTPKEQTQEIMGLDTKMYIVEEKDGVYMVREVEVLGTEKMSEKEQKERLKGAQAGVASNVNGTITKEEEIKLNDKCFGRAFEAKVKLAKKNGGDTEGVMKTRIYFANGNLYQIMAAGTEKWVSSKEVKKFLESFEVK